MIWQKSLFFAAANDFLIATLDVAVREQGFLLAAFII
jgi:hypothetical protein